MQRSSDVKRSAGGTIKEVCNFCKYQASRLVERRGGGGGGGGFGKTVRAELPGKILWVREGAAHSPVQLGGMGSAGSSPRSFAR